MRLISAASVALLAYLVWGSRGWPLIHDAPLMHYVAWLIEQGAVPYRDAFDMNFPGVYLLHLAVLRVGGAGDLAWRLFDLGWLAATCGLLVVYCHRIGHGWGPVAGRSSSRSTISVAAPGMRASAISCSASFSCSGPGASRGARSRARPERSSGAVSRSGWA